MGQAAKCNIRIEMKDGHGVPLGITSKTAIQQSMLKYYYKTNPEAVGEPDITVTECSQYESEVELELYSTRRQNLDFQIDLLLNYLNSNFDDTIEEINLDTWIQA